MASPPTLKPPKNLIKIHQYYHSSYAVEYHERDNKASRTNHVGQPDQ